MERPGRAPSGSEPHKGAACRSLLSRRKVRSGDRRARGAGEERNGQRMVLGGLRAQSIPATPKTPSVLVRTSGSPPQKPGSPLELRRGAGRLGAMGKGARVLLECSPENRRSRNMALHRRLRGAKITLRRPDPILEKPASLRRFYWKRHPFRAWVPKARKAHSDQLRGEVLHR